MLEPVSRDQTRDLTGTDRLTDWRKGTVTDVTRSSFLSCSEIVVLVFGREAVENLSVL